MKLHIRCMNIFNSVMPFQENNTDFKFEINNITLFY